MSLSIALPMLNHNWVTGFSDGESTFSVHIEKSNKSKTGWIVIVQPSFSIGLHGREIILLNYIQSFFQVGNISIRKSGGSAHYYVRGIKDLTNAIIPHFDKYPLLTQKHAYFLLFKSIIELMNEKEHLTSEGLLKIVNIKAALNLGLSEALNS